MPPATPGCSASMQGFHLLEMHPQTADQHRRTCHQHHQLGRQHGTYGRPRPAGRLGSPGTEISTAAPPRRREKHRDHRGPAGGGLPRLTPQHGPDNDGQQVSGDRDGADHAWTGRLVGANPSSARRSEPRDQERDHRSRTPRHQRDRDIANAHPDAIAQQPEQGANLERAAETPRLGRNPAENRDASKENPARESRQHTTHDG